jgi:hypothetical protein
MKYYVHIKAREDGTRVVHREDCQYVPNPENRKALGDAASCETAMHRARDDFDRIDGCATCCTECHSG